MQGAWLSLGSSKVAASMVACEIFLVKTVEPAVCLRALEPSGDVWVCKRPDCSLTVGVRWFHIGLSQICAYTVPNAAAGLKDKIYREFWRKNAVSLKSVLNLHLSVDSEAE